MTDWEELIDLVHAMPHKADTSYPEPSLGDVWLIDAPFWDRASVERARKAHVHVLLIGTDTSDADEAAGLGVDVMIGNSIDPDEILHWVQEKMRERPKLRKAQKTGTIVTFAGLLPTGGGAGKDTLVINTAAWLAARGKTVAVVDLDPYGTLKNRLKVDTTLSVDAWEEQMMNIPLTPDLVKKALVRVEHLGFSLLPASSKKDILPDQTIRHMATWLPQAFDIVIWNLGSEKPGKNFVAALHSSDHIFLVAIGDRAKFEMYEDTLSDYRDVVTVDPKVVFNKFYDKDAPAFFEEDHHYPVFAYALEDRRVFELNERGKSVALEQPKRPFGMAVKKIGQEILGETEDVKPKRGGLRFW